MVFNSVYEIFSPLTIPKNQRFWDWMSGDDLKSYWTVTQINGTGNTVTMSDSVDGGVVFTTSGTASDQVGINFNNINQYSETGSVCIFISKSVESTLRRSFGGMSNVQNGQTDTHTMNNDTNNTFYQLFTRQTSATLTNTDIAIDESYHIHKIESKASTCEYSIDGVLKATSSTNLATSPFQPVFEIIARTGSVRTANLRYVECFNT